MSTWIYQPRRRRGLPRWIVDGRPLAKKQLHALWKAYQTDRRQLALRNRLVEHYLPFVRTTAAAIAKTMRLHDTENAVGEALAALVEDIVPHFDGTVGFRAWAGLCVKRKLVDLQREEQAAENLFVDAPCERKALEETTGEPELGGELDFHAFTADLSDREALVLWLRYYRRMSVNGVAALIKASPRSSRLRRAA